jgi:acetolactate synthase-1/2/3 large subunit
LAGGGCRISGAKEAVVSLAEKLSIPVVVSLLGKDSFPNDHKLFVGFIGAYGNRSGNVAMSKSDLLLVLGSRFDSRQTGNVLTPFCEKTIFQVDLEPDETDRRFPKRRYIVSDVGDFLEQFDNLVDPNKLDAARIEWLAYLRRLKQVFTPSSEPRRAKVKTFHYEVMGEISRNLGSEDVVCVDIGQNQMLAAQVLEIRKQQRFITSGGMAPMGYALPAGISIAVENNTRVVIIAGDGGMQLNIHELNTVGKLGLPLVIFVFNNRSLGMIKQFQDLYFDSCYCDTDENSGYYSPNFVNISKAYGIKAFRTDPTKPGWRKKIAGVLQDDAKLPVLVEIDFDYSTHIYPKLEFDKPLDKLDPRLREDEEEEIGN